MISTLLCKQLKHGASNVAHMFLFIYEHQLCWVHRQSGHVYWSDFPILQNNIFCNNYRELERGTRYFRTQVLKITSTMSRTDFIAEILWRSYIYRQINRLETFWCFQFPKWDNHWLSLKNMEHVLCKYSKFVKIEQFNHKPRRLFRSNAHMTDLLCHSCGHNGHERLRWCNTCFNAYCRDCHNDPSSGPSWICSECLRQPY